MPALSISTPYGPETQLLVLFLFLYRCIFLWTAWSSLFYAWLLWLWLLLALSWLPWLSLVCWTALQTKISPWGTIKNWTELKWTEPAPEIRRVGDFQHGLCRDMHATAWRGKKSLNNQPEAFICNVQHRHTNTHTLKTVFWIWKFQRASCPLACQYYNWRKKHILFYFFPGTKDGHGGGRCSSWRLQQTFSDWSFLKILNSCQLRTIQILWVNQLGL